MMKYDVIVIGGSFGGISAALQLVRARRDVLLIDAGLPRNRFSPTVHGFLGQDGKSPRHIIEDAMRQLQAYPTIEFVHGEAISTEVVDNGFRVYLQDGQSHTARRLILAIGLRDELPPLPGLQERWGITTLVCPYCHGYEVAGQKLGVLANHPMAPRHALTIKDWGPTTYFTQGRFEPSAEDADQMEAHGIHIERSPIVALLGEGQDLECVKLSDGRNVPVQALFTMPHSYLASPLAEQLGCTITQGPAGPYISTDEGKQTSVPGVYAAGDAANAMYNSTLASASGVLAGISVHHSLMG